MALRPQCFSSNSSSEMEVINALKHRPLIFSLKCVYSMAFEESNFRFRAYTRFKLNVSAGNCYEELKTAYRKKAPNKMRQNIVNILKNILLSILD